MLDISLGLLVLTAVVFFVLLILLNSWVYKPLLAFMQQRDESIKRDLENAVSNEDESQKLLQEAQAIIAEARTKAAKEKQEKLDALKKEIGEQVASKRAELEKRYEEFLAEIAQEEEQIKNALISQMPLLKEALKAKFNQL
ncbi:hypothetical protein [Nitratiruptor sp. YY09-18]|uniref:F0F1 ATP synthase subunit B family protein n=1 Tax=Nitratiruptor sp. YY09-18 TaxID=2724901 RepID=UPI0019166CEC|nr:hypothetical protein [Nitratiruptor sp. YY09-18]BCD67777.1 F-type H+-transporting ATPase subunit b [Nitratiruptor sp. YY09-18]